MLLGDMAAVCVAGRRGAGVRDRGRLRAGRPPGARGHGAVRRPARVGAPGAAFANGVLANALDFDDGHRLTKGHPGAVVIPAALAVAQLVDASEVDFLTAVVVGYEVAIRAGIALHASRARLPRLRRVGQRSAPPRPPRGCSGSTPIATLAALGLAEYHAPIAPIMRSCAEPAMTKDACAWGACVGVTSALLAARGFTSVRAEFPDAELDDLGRRWRLEELYVKAYPCCRWSQGAIAAALAACGGRTMRRRRDRARAGADLRRRRRAGQGHPRDDRGGPVQPRLAAGLRAGPRAASASTTSSARSPIPTSAAVFTRIEVDRRSRSSPRRSRRGG